MNLVLPLNLGTPENGLILVAVVLLAEKFVVKLAFEYLLCCDSLRLSGFIIGLITNYLAVGDKVVYYDYYRLKLSSINVVCTP